VLDGVLYIILISSMVHRENVKVLEFGDNPQVLPQAGIQQH
jgi:hypothetical protein